MKNGCISIFVCVAISIAAFLSMKPANAEDVSLSIPRGSAPTISKALAARDVLGIKLGMTTQEVASILESEGYDVDIRERPVSIKFQIDGKTQKFDSAPFIRAVNGSIREGFHNNYISVGFSSPINGNVAISILRYIKYIRDTAPQADEVLHSLSKKYNIDFGNRSNYVDSMFSDGKNSLPNRGYIDTASSFETLRESTHSFTPVPRLYYFSAGIEKKIDKVEEFSVLIFDTNAYLQDKNMLDNYLAKFIEERRKKVSVLPSPKL